MSKFFKVFFISISLFIAYNVFLIIFPLNVAIFKSNEERIEEYIYEPEYKTLIIGSSLNGALEETQFFKERYLNMYTAYTGSRTGLEVINKIGYTPQRLFIEINHFDRDIDSALIDGIFKSSSYWPKFYVPSLLKKNKFVPNIINRAFTPTAIGSKVKPPEKLYKKLLYGFQKEWGYVPDTMSLIKKFDSTSAFLQNLAKKGTAIYFYEVPMDKSLYNSPILKFERHYFYILSKRLHFHYIPPDTTRNYNTGDGIHLLKKDAKIFSQYLRKKIMTCNNETK